MTAGSAANGPAAGAGSARGVLIVMAKAPRPGLAKTRMCPPLSSVQAAEFYGCMLDDVLETTKLSAAALGLEPVIAVHPVNALGEIADRTPPAFRVIAQRGEGLGARMDRAIRQGFASGAERVLVRGSDNPALSPEHLLGVFESSMDHDVVLTPDSDGGYGAVAVSRPLAGLFDHPMSKGSVLEETVSGARRAGLDVALAEPCFDLDCFDDLAELDAWRQSVGDSGLCGRTLTWLDEMGLWPDA